MKYYPDTSEKEQKRQLEEILNGGIEFEVNIKGALVDLTTTGAEQEILHGLGKIPIGFFVMYIESSGSGPYSVWASRIDEWTKEKLFCKSNAASLRARLFVV